MFPLNLYIRYVFFCVLYFPFFSDTCRSQESARSRSFSRLAASVRTVVTG